MPDPGVSVVMASYNHERFVHEAVASVLAQSRQDFEFVVTDDGSADATADIIASFGDPRIHLTRFARKRGGVGGAGAANHNLRQCRGRYIAILNSDDAFAPEKLEVQARYLDTHPDVAAVFTWVQLVDELGTPFTDATYPQYRTFDQANRSRHAWLNHFFLHGNCLCHPTLMIRAEVRRELGYYDERFQQLCDLDMWVRLCMRHEIHVLPERLTRFRVRTDHANASSPTHDVVARSLWEYRRVLERYLDLRAADFAQVFPNARADFEFEDADVPYALARVALATRDGFRELFGLETLYRLLEGPAATRLEERFAFTTADLLRLARDADPFNVARLKRLSDRVAQLQVDLDAQERTAQMTARARPQSMLAKVLASAFKPRR